MVAGGFGIGAVHVTPGAAGGAKNDVESGESLTGLLEPGLQPCDNIQVEVIFMSDRHSHSEKPRHDLGMIWAVRDFERG